MHYFLDLDPWGFDITRVTPGKWVCLPVVTVPWLTVDHRFAATGSVASSLPDALLQARQRLADPGLSLQEIHLRLEAEADRAAQRFHPLQQHIAARARRFELVWTVECLPTGLDREVAMALVNDGFDSTPHQLLAAARAIAA
jgi:hypothetical protein